MPTSPAQSGPQAARDQRAPAAFSKKAYADPGLDDENATARAEDIADAVPHVVGHHRRAVQRRAFVRLPAQRCVEILVPQGEQAQHGDALARRMRDRGLDEAPVSPFAGARRLVVDTIDELGTPSGRVVLACRSGQRALMAADRAGFAARKRAARKRGKLGFEQVRSGPLVRSSYHAAS